MSTTLENSAASASTTNTTTTSESPAKAPAAGAAAGAQPAAPAEATAEKTGGEKKEKAAGGAQGALRRAQARLADQKKQTTSSASASPEQASGDKTAGESTQDGAAPAGSDGKQTAGADGGDKSPTGSTVTAPNDWPAPYRERFEKLPNEARDIVLDFQKDFQRAFTHKTTQLAELTKGREADLTIAEEFRKSPKETLAKLAKQANVEVFFERPLPAGQIPKFETQEELLAYMEQKNQEAISKALADKDAQDREAAEADKARTTLRAEFTQAAKDYPDFGDHKQRVVEIMQENPSLSVAHAYQLATYDGLRQLALAGEKLKAELASVKTELETLKKKATTPPPGSSSGRVKADVSELSPGQRAFAKAKQKIAARQARIN